MLICNKSIISDRNNQVFSKYYNVIVQWIKGGELNLKDDDHILMNNRCTTNRIKILQTIIKFTGIYSETYISQENIAKICGIHHDTVLRALKLFHELGIIKKVYRGANRTCMYSLGKFFNDDNVRWALKEVLPNLYWAIQSSIRRCKSMLSGLIGGLCRKISFRGKNNTARLSKDKMKDLNIIKDDIKNNQKDKNLKMTELDQAKLKEYLELERIKKDKIAEEFRNMLFV